VGRMEGGGPQLPSQQLATGVRQQPACACAGAAGQGEVGGKGGEGVSPRRRRAGKAVNMLLGAACWPLSAPTCSLSPSGAAACWRSRPLPALPPHALLASSPHLTSAIHRSFQLSCSG
jgi:hypothetical protein